jgi:hypothetical protein
LKFPKFYLGKMIEEKQRNEGLLGTIFFLMGYLRWGRGDNATGVTAWVCLVVLGVVFSRR